MRENSKHKRKKPNEELAAFEKKYVDLMENINSAVYKTNEHGIFTFISKSVQNIFGYQPDDIVGKHILDFVYEEDSSKAKSSFARLAIEKKVHEEMRLKSKDGSVKLVKLIHAAVFEDSKFAGDMGIVVDIYDSMRKENSLGFHSELLNGVCEAAISVDKDKMSYRGDINKSNQELIKNALQEVEIGLREIFDKSTIIFYSYTPDGLINFASTQVKSMLGFDPAAIKMKCSDFVKDRPVNRNGIELSKKAIETGIPQEPFEIEIKNSKNEVFWFEVRELPIVKDGKTVLMVGSLKDITDRKKAEEELHTNQSLLIDALEMASMGHWEYDVASDTFTFNDQFYKMLRSSIEEIGRYTMSSSEYAKRFFHKDDHEIVVKEIQDSVKTADPNYHRELEHRIIFPDGKIGTLAARYKIVKDGNGNTIKIYGVDQDITERKMAELELKNRGEKLAESEKFLENIIENIPNMVFVKDAKDLTFIKMNRAGEELLGLTRDELIGKNDFDFFPKDQVDFFLNKDREAINSNICLEIPEERISTCKNGERILHTKKIAIRDDNGIPKYLLGISEDITRRKAEERELLEAKEKAEEMNRLKSYFLANMSHELRTPMIGILGFADILLEELTNPSHIEMISTITNSGKRLISTLNSILDLSLIESNKQDINKSLVSLNEIIKEVIQFYESDINNKNIYLKCVFPKSEVHLNSDKNLLLKIFNNLIDNAVKYTNEGGILIKIIVPDKKPDNKILIEIIDTGIGISKEFHNKIFEPFRQVSEGYSRKFEGTGLGLNITKKCVELLNGTITLKSELGKGSTFTITFPYTNYDHDDNSTDEITPVKNETTISTLNDLNILLVEDDFTNASVINSFLKGHLKLDHASDGQTAIDFCNSKKYDGVLMDISLKGIDGVETFRNIRKIDNHYSKIPIIAMTAHAMSGDREKFLSYGFTNYLSKPFGRSQLLMLLNETFKKDQ